MHPSPGTCTSKFAIRASPIHVPLERTLPGPSDAARARLPGTNVPSSLPVVHLLLVPCVAPPLVPAEKLIWDQYWPEPHTDAAATIRGTTQVVTSWTFASVKTLLHERLRIRGGVSLLLRQEGIVPRVIRLVVGEEQALKRLAGRVLRHTSHCRSTTSSGFVTFPVISTSNVLLESREVRQVKRSTALRGRELQTALKHKC